VKGKDDTFVSPDLAVLNMSLQGIGEAPFIKRKIDTRENYFKRKMKSIK